MSDLEPVAPVEIDWAARLSLTCPGCGCKAVVVDVCAACGTRKSAYGTPWLAPVAPRFGGLKK